MDEIIITSTDFVGINYCGDFFTEGVWFINELNVRESGCGDSVGYSVRVDIWFQKRCVEYWMKM